MSNHITFLGVLRITDTVMVASVCPSKQTDDAYAIKNLLSSGNFVEPGRRHTEEGEVFSIHYVCDEGNMVYCTVTDNGYPARVAFAMLDELATKFITKVGDKGLRVPEGGLTRTMKDSMIELCRRFEDVESQDKLTKLKGKVDIVKRTMEDNIQQMLANEEKLDDIGRNADALNVQAGDFADRANRLRQVMRCKAIKMWLLLSLAVIILLIIIIVPIALWCKANC